MDKEEHHDEVQREASAAGLVVAVIFMVFACVAILLGVTFWPALDAAAPPPTSLSEQIGK